MDNNLYGRAVGIDERGKFAAFKGAVESALGDLVREKNDFFDSLADRWEELFPGLAARPGRYESGIIFLYVKNAPTFFALRPKLRTIKAKLAKISGAPKKFELKLEIHSR